MTTTVLDDQAKEVLRTLRAGDHFSLRSARGRFLCKEWVHPVEGEPWVRAFVIERGGYLGNFHAIRVSRIGEVLPRRAA